jgi:hypothetical protein
LLHRFELSSGVGRLSTARVRHQARNAPVAVEARRHLLDCVQLTESILDPVLVTVLHLLEFRNNVVEIPNSVITNAPSAI